MSSLNMEVINGNGTITVKFSGSLTEGAVLKPIAINASTKVFFDHGGITHINSSGVREWIRWITNFDPNLELTYVNCPKCIIDQVNLVAGFLGKRNRVLSFYVPFVCNKCLNQTQVLFKHGEHFDNKGIRYPKIDCPKCSVPTELDVIEEKYFRFLKVI